MAAISKIFHPSSLRQTGGRVIQTTGHSFGGPYNRNQTAALRQACLLRHRSRQDRDFISPSSTAARLLRQ